MADHTITFTLKSGTVSISSPDESVVDGDTVTFKSGSNTAFHVNFSPNWPFSGSASTIDVPANQSTSKYTVAGSKVTNGYTVTAGSGENAPQSSGEIDIDPSDR